MIQELTNNEIFSNEYRNIAPKAGDLAAVFEKNGRNLLMRLDAEGAMSLPEAVLFADYWFDPEDSEADKKAAEKGGRLVCFRKISISVRRLLFSFLPGTTETVTAAAAAVI